MEARFASVIDALEQINTEEYRDIDESFGAYEEKFTEQIAQLQADISKPQTYVNALRVREGRIASLTAEIRSKGRELLEEKRDTKKCPLCGADYEIGELAKRIDEVTAEVGESELLKNALASLSALEGQIRATQTQYEKLEKLRYAVSLQLDISDPSEMKLTDVVSSLAAVGDQINTLKRKSEELATLRDRLEAQGLTAENYRSIGEWYMETYYQPMPDYSRRDEFKKILTAEESTLQEQKRALQETQKDIDKDQEKAQLLIKQYSGQSPESLGDLSGVRKRYELIRDACQKCEATLRNIAASDDETFSDLSLRLSEIRATHERFSAAKKQIEESGHIKAKNEGKIKKTQSIIDKLTPRKERADIAVTTIEDILQHDSKEKHVQDFLGENLQEIVRVFRMMHAPREFSDLEFDPITGALRLVRRVGQTRSGVTEISSGQRAALSLSIFLVLNGKLSNGPPFIILDDPIAHVDDLNILSFFDYLRELIISGNRQLFFATASEKVASLYRKKFDFLKDEFCDTLLTISLAC
jgi:chromosome segregation ATPase